MARRLVLLVLAGLLAGCGASVAAPDRAEPVLLAPPVFGAATSPGVV